MENFSSSNSIFLKNAFLTLVLPLLPDCPEAMEHYTRGNELFVDENYVGALEAFSKAIETDEAIETSKLASFHVKRAAAHLKLKQYDEALDDGTKAVEFNPDLEMAYLRKGTAAFHLEEFETAKAAFAAGKSLQHANGGDVSNYVTWIRKCDAELEDMDSSDEDSDGTPEAAAAAPESSPAPVENVPPAKPAGYRYDWYQTQNYVVLTVMAKQKKAEEVNVSFASKNVCVSIAMENGNEYLLDLDVFDEIDADSSSFKIMSTKVEVKLIKVGKFQWPSLERPEDQVILKTAAGETQVSTSYNTKPKAYSSNKDWDAIGTDLKKQEEEEKLEGEDALNKLFRDIYSKANEETRRAMNKSFQTSGGTVLSTNWGEVSDKDYEKEKVAPDGMEWRNWEGDKLKKDGTPKE